MSHLHIPDGVISNWLWILGYILTFIYLFIFSKISKKHNPGKIYSKISIMTALMLLCQSIPIPLPIPYHLNLSAVAAIVLGPFYAGISIFVLNLLLSLLGHGGITIAGLNTVILLFEALIAFYIYKFALRYFKNIFISAFIATLIALIVSTSLSFTVVYTGLQINNASNSINNNYSQHMEKDNNSTSLHNEAHDHDVDVKKELIAESFSIKKFLLLIITFAGIGWIIESTISAYIIEYINKIKPDLII